MAFFTRPDLDNRQFKQLSGATLTLSGETNFSGTLKSKGIEIDASTGGTGNTGHVLTFSSGKISLLPSVGGSGDTDSSFDGQRLITQVLSPPKAAGDLGTTGLSQFIDAFFFPTLAPVITQWELSSNTIARQFGDSSDTGSGGEVLEWNVIIGTNDLTSLTVNGNSIAPLAGVTGSTGDTTSYSVNASNFNPVTGTTAKTETYSMNATDGITNLNEVVTITWTHKRFWFGSTIKYLVGDDSLIDAVLTGLTTNELSTGITKTFDPITLNNEYFYYAYPLQFVGVPEFTVNGLLNTAWGDAPSTLFTFLYTNTDGYLERFYLASSDNRLSATFNIDVTLE